MEIVSFLGLPPHDVRGESHTTQNMYEILETEGQENNNLDEVPSKGLTKPVQVTKHIITSSEKRKRQKVVVVEGSLLSGTESNMQHRSDP